MDDIIKERLHKLHAWDKKNQNKMYSINPFYYCKNLPSFFKDTPVRWSSIRRVPYLPFDYMIDTSEAGEFAKTVRIPLTDILPIDKLFIHVPKDSTPTYKNNIGNKTRKAIANRLISFMITFLEEIILTEDIIIQLLNGGDTYQFYAVTHTHPKNKDSFDIGLAAVSKKGNKMFFLNQQPTSKSWKREYMYKRFLLPEIKYKNRTE